MQEINKEDQLKEQIAELRKRLQETMMLSFRQEIEIMCRKEAHEIFIEKLSEIVMDEMNRMKKQPELKGLYDMEIK